MNKLFLTIVAVLSTLLIMAANTNADIIKITANSDSYGELGWFAVDDVIFLSDRTLAASQFYDYWWSDPISRVSISPTDVTGDTGLTYFDRVGNVWTVTGGGNDSLTTLTTGLQIAGNFIVNFINNGSYSDVSWTTTDYIDPVPEPATILLLGSGLFSFPLLRKRFKK